MRSSVFPRVEGQRGLRAEGGGWREGRVVTTRSFSEGLLCAKAFLPSSLCQALAADESSLVRRRDGGNSIRDSFHAGVVGKCAGGFAFFKALIPLLLWSAWECAVRFAVPT